MYIKIPFMRDDSIFPGIPEKAARGSLAEQCSPRRVSNANHSMAIA